MNATLRTSRLRTGSSPYRRRILYLRNYAASSAVFAPLAAPLSDAFSTADLS